ncbi:MAG: hypothetical protein KBS46_01310 [Clostridiales bacterium]|nr:hypothetical protein [Candidatus Apopatocola equi]MCQ2438471.1 hypothetical protein [Oscillospiraceae bacterium]
MIHFTMKLCGLTIAADVNYAYTRDFCRDYIVDDVENPDIAITVTEEDIREEDRLNLEAEAKKHIPPRNYTIEYLEVLNLGRQCMIRLFPYNIILFHSAAVVLNGEVYLFSASSGVGKSWHSQLWLKHFPECYILNGDKPLLHFTEEGIMVCGCPWQGKECLGVNEMKPLKAVCMIHRDTVNTIEKVTVDSAIGEIMKQANHTVAATRAEEEALIRGLSAVDVYRLGCNMDDEAAFVARRAMVGDV